MKWYIPLFSCEKETNKLLRKAKRFLQLSGSFIGYDMKDDEIMFIQKGSQGWNLFINENATDEQVRCGLHYLIKNKKAFLFDMKNAEEYKIELNYKRS